jgi:LuxR family maltose regulon positive regulatory protein
MHHAREGIRLSGLGGFLPYQVFSHVLLARAHEAQGDRASAMEALQEAGRLGAGCDYALPVALVDELRVRLWLVQGNTEAASRWAQERTLSADDVLDSSREVEQTAVARVLIIQNRSSEAVTLLSHVLEAARAAGRMGSVIKILTLQALACEAQSNMDEASSALEQALSLAQPEGYVRTFVDEGQPMARLLRRALSQGSAPNYVARLLAAFGEEIEVRSPAMGQLVEPLSERELEVLRLVVAGLSNPEIAQELVIAVSTVKSHVNHIYGKLGVVSRTQAVARARELGLP